MIMSLKQRKIKFKPRIKLNHPVFVKSWVSLSHAREMMNATSFLKNI